MVNKLDEKALGYAGGIISGLCMLLLTLLSGAGIYAGAAEMMTRWHMFYAMTFAGTITGMIEAAVIGFVSFYVFGWIYNKFV